MLEMVGRKLSKEFIVVNLTFFVPYENVLIHVYICLVNGVYCSNMLQLYCGLYCILVMG